MDIQSGSYDTLKEYYNNTLNKDKTTYKSSNDEPTPIECVEEMLDVLPHTFWQREDLKLLDPCCGNGNFHLVAYNKLKEHHDIQDITKNILHFNDINDTRINNVRKVFCDDKYSLNITTEDFLAKQYNDKFDAVIANPPYAKILDDGKRASKNHNLIKLFLEKSLSILKPNGYLVFITPDNWMSYADRNEIIQKFTELQIIHLNIHCAKKSNFN